MDADKVHTRQEELPLLHPLLQQLLGEVEGSCPLGALLHPGFSSTC